MGNMWPTAQCDIVWVSRITGGTPQFVLVGSTSELADNATVADDELIIQACESRGPVFPEEPAK